MMLVGAGQEVQACPGPAFILPTSLMGGRKVGLQMGGWGDSVSFY